MTSAPVSGAASGPRPGITVMVTGVGSTTGISVIKGLRQQDEFAVRVVGTDINDYHAIAGSTWCDVFYKVPLAVDPAYIQSLLALCERERVQVLIPINDPELLSVAQERAAFTALGTKAYVSDYDSVLVCNDKLQTCQLLREHGIPVPSTWLAADVAAPSGLAYPVFVKPRDGVSSVNAVRIDTADDFERMRARVPNLVVQEYLVGEEYTTDLLADEGGRAFAAVPRLRQETKAGISYKGKTVHHPQLEKWAVDIARVLKIRGAANVQCRVAGDQIAYFEVNPRFSGGLPLTIAAGVNSPLWLLKLASGQPAPAERLPFHNLSMTRYWSEVFHPAEPD